MRHAGRHSTGFTLIELVAVMSVVALVAGAGVTLMWQIAAMRQRADQKGIATREAAVAVDALAVAIANAYRPGEGDRVLFEGVDEMLDDRPADRLRLLTMGDQPVRGGDARESDLREVEFELDTVDGESLPVLMQRIDPTRNVPPDEGGVRQPVARQVRAMDLRFFDGIGWQDAWPITMNRLPRAVRIDLAVAEVDERGIPRDDAQHVVVLRRLVAIQPMPQRNRRPRNGGGR